MRLFLVTVLDYKSSKSDCYLVAKDIEHALKYARGCWVSSTIVGIVQVSTGVWIDRKHLD